jgi:hypothetical protein
LGIAQWLATNKATKSSTIVDKLKTLSSSSKKSMVGFHCCSLNNAASQPLSNIFGSILAQVCRERPDFLQYVEDYSHANSSLIPQNDLTFGQIQGIFKNILESIECLYILVDALNETPFLGQVVQGLIRLCSQHPQIRVLVTCTKGPPTKHSLIRERDMPANDVGHDIELYVNHRLHVEPSFRGLNPRIQAEIRQVMALKSEGMYVSRLFSARLPRSFLLALFADVGQVSLGKALHGPARCASYWP